MKSALLFLALCACVAVSTSTGHRDERGISDVIEKIKAFYEYINSEEFKNMLSDLVAKLEAAPDHAVQCFTESSQGSEAERTEIGEKIHKILEEAFHKEEDEDENGLQKLIRIVRGIIRVSTDKEIREHVMEIAGEYKDAAAAALDCFKQDLLAVKDQAEKVIKDIEQRFFS